MGTPPGYAMFHPTDGVIPEGYKDTDDYRRWSTIPEAIRSELAEYYRKVQAGELFDRTDDFARPEVVRAAIESGRLEIADAELAKGTRIEIPCLWYDSETQRCKHHEHRPDICREFEIDSPECHASRKRWRIPLPLA